MADLIDVRSKVSPRTHAVLTAISLATGKDIAELVREIADIWAESKVHEATLIQRVLKGEGLAGESKGIGS